MVKPISRSFTATRALLFVAMLMLAAAVVSLGLACQPLPPPQNSGQPAAARPPECRMSSDGTNVCGYNCQYASNGQVSCASRPDGHCAFNSDGTLSCP